MFSELYNDTDLWLPCVCERLFSSRVFLCIQKNKIMNNEKKQKNLVPVIGVTKIFDWGAGGKSHAIMSLETSKQEFFVGGKDIIEWKIKSHGLMLARN